MLSSFLFTLTRWRASSLIESHTLFHRFPFVLHFFSWCHFCLWLVGLLGICLQLLCVGGRLSILTCQIDVSMLNVNPYIKTGHQQQIKHLIQLQLLLLSFTSFTLELILIRVWSTLGMHGKLFWLGQKAKEPTRWMWQLTVWLCWKQERFDWYDKYPPAYPIINHVELNFSCGSWVQGTYPTSAVTSNWPLDMNNSLIG